MEMPVSHSLTDRMVGAAKLQVWAYEEVEADQSATGQAALVVALVTVASAIGAWGNGGRGIIAAVISALLGWLLWAAVTYFIGTRLFEGTATWGELLRTLGFAQSPGVLYLLAIIPILGWFVRLALWIWILVAGIVAIRQALDFDTGRAVATAVIGWLVVMVVTVMVAAVAGVGGLMASAF